MDALGLYDIYGYRYQPFWQTMLFKGIAIVIVVLASALIGYLLLRAWRLRQATNPWRAWLSTLDLLQRKKQEPVIFYAKLAAVIKGCAVLKLHATESLTDLELALFLKSRDDVGAVRALGEIMERAAAYKFDPVYTAPMAPEKEVVYVREALNSIQQMERKQ